MFGGKAYLWTCALVAVASSSCVIDAQSAYDVVVVGSGPGGLVAAEYLSRDPGVSVLIIEAGPKSLAAVGGTVMPDYAAHQDLTKFDILGEYETILGSLQFQADWFFESRLGLAKLVGGCSSINAAMYFRPPNSYVEQMQWPFSAESMVAKMDENEQTHGVTITPSLDGLWYLQEGYQIVAKAFSAQGYSERIINDAAARNSKSKTYGHAPFATKNARRDSPANAFWGKMKTRSNVKLMTDTMVDYILHSSGKATGVIYAGGNMAKLSSRGTVIMAAGALSTPKVLIQSGIGPTDQLNLLKGNSNFPGVAQGAWIINPFVGRSMFDTNGVLASFSHPNMKSFRYVDHPSSAINQYMTNKSGPWSSSGPVLIGYENFEVQGRMYEFQTTVLPHGIGEFSKRDDALAATLFLNNPEARAACGFDRNGMWHAVKEGNAYFGTTRDLVAMQQYVQKVVNAMTAAGATFLSAGSDANSVADWVSRNRGLTVNHFGGTCYASRDSSTGSRRCADEKLRVLGTSNIFVADASAMRDGTVNPYGFVMYIGREAAEQAASYFSSGGASTVQTLSREAGCSTIEENVDYLGNDVGNVRSSTAEGCCTICRTANGCKVFTWTNYNGGTCWLKSAKDSVSISSGMRSAQLS